MSLSDARSMPNGKVTYASADGVALLTLTNPPANGYSHEMMLDLDRAILEARFDDAVQVLVLAGEGEKFFCRRRGHRDAPRRHAELQVRLLPARQRDAPASRAHAEARDRRTRWSLCGRRTRDRAGLPTCAWRGKGSGKCGLPEVALGVLPGTGGTQRMAADARTRSTAIELMASGRAVRLRPCSGPRAGRSKPDRGRGRTQSFLAQRASSTPEPVHESRDASALERRTHQASRAPAAPRSPAGAGTGARA